MRDTIEIIKAMADRNRARILMALYRGELCVCHITELVELAPSTVSKHMSILRNARLVEYRKQGRWIYYRLSTEKECPEAAKAIKWLHEMLKDDKIITGDCKRLKHIGQCRS